MSNWFDEIIESFAKETENYPIEKDSDLTLGLKNFREVIQEIYISYKKRGADPDESLILSQFIITNSYIGVHLQLAIYYLEEVYGNDVEELA